MFLNSNRRSKAMHWKAVVMKTALKLIWMRGKESRKPGDNSGSVTYHTNVILTIIIKTKCQQIIFIPF